MNMFEKVTLYYLSAFGTSKVEAKSVDVEVKPYAQHPEATHVRYVEKGKRKVKGFVQTTKPNVVVVEGWGHALDPKAFTFETTADGLGEITRFSCFSPEWLAIHTAFIEALKATGVNVLFDTRKA